MDNEWWRYFIIGLAEVMEPDNYLELGIQTGITFTAVCNVVKRKAIGVDSTSYGVVAPSNAEIFIMTTDEFFKSPPDLKFDLIFIDANHDYKQARKDFLNASNMLADNGIILLHDTFPMDKSYTEHMECSDSYKLAWAIRTMMRKEFEIVTLPRHPGISIIRKAKKQVPWI